MTRIASVVAIAAFCCAPYTLAEETAHWTYTGNTGPEHWADLSDDFEACRLGKNQSPINIETELIVEAALAPLVLDYQGSTENIVNNGHTLQVNVSGQNTLTVEGKVFQLQQFHFHSPSEHQIDGEKFALEAHFVHQNKTGELAVVSMMFRSGKETTNPVLIEFGELGSPNIGEETVFSRPIAELAKRSDGNISSYYRYNGSLTTPPCTEGLRWYVIPRAELISEEQVSSYIKLIGADARGPQPINARIVLQRK